MDTIEKPDILKKHKINFITYGDDKYKRARERLYNQAVDFNIFHDVKIFTNNSLTDEFKENYKDILKMRRGGGYWIWKLDIIKQSLDTMDENDFLVYLDSGCELNKKGLKRFYEYFEMFENTDYGILSFQMTGNYNIGGLCKEKEWTIKEIFDYFDIDINSENAENGQLMATCLIMRKNDHLRKYLKMFDDCLNHNKFLITDLFNNNNQHSFFRDNRHDQSISSIIRKKIGSIVVDSDESFVTPFGSERSLNYPIWAKRSRI